ncbi:tetratricopeptide repeat protein [Alicyclobacillus tolerans]|uniref:tetratricopeptide repeat protein n=1 Tax=Alicyclobacillus tolerans TaxID=90970 RepID=UPI001F334BB7|nr:tetratricopeptide repeat protein [Alicyclobacillus tolerans]MCF8568383.1 tetratricopeptide repeat protein [Alicyclobacillus tolerans]
MTMNVDKKDESGDFNTRSDGPDHDELRGNQRIAVQLLLQSKLNVQAWKHLGVSLEGLGLLGSAYKAYCRASLLDPHWKLEQSAEMRAQTKWQEAIPKWLNDLLAVPPVSVAACILARGEGDLLAEMVQQLMASVDEVIVVDAGCPNDIMRHVVQLGAQVVEVNWKDDLSAARNVGLSHLTSDWVLFLDADETVSQEDVEVIREVVGLFHDEAQKSFLRIIRLNHIGDELITHDREIRLFPTAYGIHWGGRLGEQIQLPPDENPTDWTEAVVRIRVHQHRYDTKQKGRQQRLEEDVQLLRQVVGEHPEDIGAWSALGQALFRLQAYEEAIECFDTVEMLAPQYPEYAPLSEARVTLARALMAQERWLEAIGVLERSLQNDPNHPSSHFYLGQAKMQLALHLLTEARESFANSQTLVNEYQGNSAYDVNIGKWKAACGIADTHKYQGHMIQAYEGYLKAQQENPDLNVFQKQTLLLELQAKEIVSMLRNRT